MNIAWAEGVVDGLGSPVHAELSPEPGRCCVVFRTALGEIAPPTQSATTGATSLLRQRGEVMEQRETPP